MQMNQHINGPKFGNLFNRTESVLEIFKYMDRNAHMAISRHISAVIGVHRVLFYK